MVKPFLANGMAAYLDFTIGCLLVVLLAGAFHVELLWWQVLIGGLLALLPDIDIAPTLLLGKSPRFDHRQTIFHRPLPILAAVAALGYWLGAAFWASAAVCLVFYHYLHDIDWNGNRYGVAWFWPFSEHFWGPYGRFMPPNNLSHETWLKDTWLQPSPQSVTELTIALIALLFLGLLLGLLTSWWFIALIVLAAAVPLTVWYW
jgi:hypothetical protein